MYVQSMEQGKQIGNVLVVSARESRAITAAIYPYRSVFWCPSLLPEAVTIGPARGRDFFGHYSGRHLQQP